MKLLQPAEPSGTIYTTMELGPKGPSLLWFWGPNSIMVVYMDPGKQWTVQTGGPKILGLEAFSERRVKQS